MPINRDDIEQGDSPITPPEGDIEEQELGQRFINMPPEQEQPEPELPESEKKLRFIGEGSYPGADKYSDGISDLFTVDEEDLDAGEGVDDLVEVDMERDILDSDEGGTLEDLVDVTEEDIMGSEEYGQRPSKPASQQRASRRKSIPRYQPPMSMGRSG